MNNLYTLLILLLLVVQNSFEQRITHLNRFIKSGKKLIPIHGSSDKIWNVQPFSTHSKDPLESHNVHMKSLDKLKNTFVRNHKDVFNHPYQDLITALNKIQEDLNAKSQSLAQRELEIQQLQFRANSYDRIYHRFKTSSTLVTNLNELNIHFADFTRIKRMWNSLQRLEIFKQMDPHLALKEHVIDEAFSKIMKHILSIELKDLEYHKGKKLNLDDGSYFIPDGIITRKNERNPNWSCVLIPIEVERPKKFTTGWGQSMSYMHVAWEAQPLRKSMIGIVTDWDTIGFSFIYNGKKYISERMDLFRRDKKNPTMGFIWLMSILRGL